MQKLKSPTPNRKGEYEIHDVPSRRVEALKALGWTEVKPEKEKPKKTLKKTKYSREKSV